MKDRDRAAKQTEAMPDAVTREQMANAINRSFWNVLIDESATIRQGIISIDNDDPPPNRHERRKRKAKAKR